MPHQDVTQELELLRRRNADLELLYDTIRDLTTTLSVREVLDRLLGRVLAHLEAEIGSILQLDADQKLRIVAAKGLPTAVVEKTSVGMGEGISGMVAATGEALLVEDIECDPLFKRRNHERYYTSSCISAPLLHNGAVRGVINVNNKRSRHPFARPDLRLLEAIAGHASAALANAHRFEQVLERAQRDSLTGLVNHGHMWSSLEVELARAQRHERSLALLLIDVDHFKDFNDTHGHQAGDEALCAVARELESSSRAHDVVARYGGEEFAVILPETALDGACIFAEKLRFAIERLRLGVDGDRRLTISAGVAVSKDAETAEALVACADERLYRAKAAGRNCVCAEPRS